MGSSSEEVINCLGENSRLLLLGGLAVIAHGFSRTTEDADVWLDSTQPMDRWIDVLQECLPRGEEIYFWDLPRRVRVGADELPAVVEELGVIRIGGLDRHVDVFRRPNELETEDFDEAWEGSIPHLGRIRLLDEAFLIATKENSERDRDRIDIGFLEHKIRERYSQRLSLCDAREASALFSRYLDHATCEAALENPDAAVRALGLAGLRELAEGGNPFAVAALRKMEGKT
jgi:hypothetical protein